MKNMKDLTQNELATICGGDPFLRDLGRMSGSFVRFMENVWDAYVDAGTTTTISGTVVGW